MLNRTYCRLFGTPDQLQASYCRTVWQCRQICDTQAANFGQAAFPRLKLLNITSQASHAFLDRPTDAYTDSRDIYTTAHLSVPVSFASQWFLLRLQAYREGRSRRSQTTSKAPRSPSIIASARHHVYIHWRRRPAVT